MTAEAAKGKTLIIADHSKSPPRLNNEAAKLAYLRKSRVSRSFLKEGGSHPCKQHPETTNPIRVPAKM